ncbi:DUF2690 domain-containing protein [Nocardia sp. NRRL S-836]|uniref:DUF2690 domain-containing protein n=1 Tax=Nocardia sp. NRRL S-836 TaxID=1519492 RepID=UPI000AAC799E|nr:DUF2690 domain-containing protein [Nocardia sp. NRRL S-836]
METQFRRMGYALMVVTAAAVFCPAVSFAGDPGCSQEEAFTPFDTSDGDNPVTTQTGRVVELRASNRSHCAWGRISSGTPGEEIWTDRREPSSQSHEGFLGYTRIDSGSAKYTEAFKNDGRVMRACGSSRGVIECTGWF